MSVFEEPNLAKTMEETDKKCPSCGGVMDFDPATGGLSCPYCGHKEAIPVDDEIPSKAEELDFESAESTENCNWGVETKTVICKACGAETIYDSLQLAAVCPFCGSNQVMEANDKNTLAPGGVVPFQITDKEAADLFKKWIKRKWFCPKLAKESAKPKSFNGVYLPYWTFDTNTRADYTAEYGKTRSIKEKNGETRTVTDWYHTSGSYSTRINDELVHASTTHDQVMLLGLEPFDTENNKAYKPEYIAGFTSERYTIGLKEAWEIAKCSINSRLRNAISSQIRSNHSADEVRDIQMTAFYQDITYKYLLLPIWISNYKYNDKVYQFMVNGQTGKVSGRSPISIGRVAVAILIGIILAVIFYFFYLS